MQSDGVMSMCAQTALFRVVYRARCTTGPWFGGAFVAGDELSNISAIFFFFLLSFRVYSAELKKEKNYDDT